MMQPVKIIAKECTACPSKLSDIRKDVAKACLQIGFSEEDINALVLAIDEACTNIIRYAYKDCRDEKFLLEIYTDGKQAVFRLHDHAPKAPKDCINIKKSDPLKPGGFGIILIREIMDSVNFLDTLNCEENILEMRKNLPQEETIK